MAGTSIRSQREKKSLSSRLLLYFPATHILLLCPPVLLHLSPLERSKVVFVLGRWHVSFPFLPRRHGALGRRSRTAQWMKEDERRPGPPYSLLHPDRRLTHPRRRLTSYLLTARTDNANSPRHRPLGYLARWVQFLAFLDCAAETRQIRGWRWVEVEGFEVDRKCKYLYYMWARCNFFFLCIVDIKGF